MLTNACSSPMLMHGILSMSALHLTHKAPADTQIYWTRATHHHTLGLRYFNSQIGSPTIENSHSLCTFSLILISWVLGSARIDAGSMGLDDILNLLDIVRGCRTVFDLYKDSILAQKFGHVIRRSNDLYGCQNLPLVVCQALENLRQVCYEPLKDTSSQGEAAKQEEGRRQQTRQWGKSSRNEHTMQRHKRSAIRRDRLGSKRDERTAGARRARPHNNRSPSPRTCATPR
jgi:hypothetical protein